MSSGDIGTLAPSEVERRIRRLRGKKLFISVAQRAPITGDEGRVFPIIGHVPVSRRQALDFMRRAYSDVLRKRGALCAWSELGCCVFIGRAS